MLYIEFVRSFQSLLAWKKLLMILNSAVFIMIIFIHVYKFEIEKQSPVRDCLLTIMYTTAVATIRSCHLYYL